MTFTNTFDPSMRGNLVTGYAALLERERAASNAEEPSEASAVVTTSNSDFFAGSLTAEGLLTYVGMRMNNIEGRINDIFNGQKRADDIRSVLREINAQLHRLNENPGDPTGEVHIADEEATAIKNELARLVNDLKKLDPALGATLFEQIMTDGGGTVGDQIGAQLGFAGNTEGGGTYTGLAVKAAKEFVSNMTKDLDASAQLKMIELQSLTSARQTAISLTTNILASVSDSLKAVVSNIK